MSEIIVATVDELRILTKRERQVYEMFRHEGKTKEEICRELRFNKDAFRRYWWAAMKKIREHRQLTQNPQYFLARGKDILSSIPTVQRHETASARHISNSSRLGHDREETLDAPIADGEDGDVEVPRELDDVGVRDELEDDDNELAE